LGTHSGHLVPEEPLGKSEIISVIFPDWLAMVL
jgi:hypothetical protein